MNCRTWEELFEEYEKATLKRVAHTKDHFALKGKPELDQLNLEIARALRELHKHETTHRCHS